MQIKIINNSLNSVPNYGTPHSSGCDLRTSIEAPVTLAPGARHLIPTGLFMAIPEGYEGQVRPRSGLAVKHGITVLNTPGAIDADYRGEIKVLLINLGNEPYTIQPGERIAQLVFARYEKAEFVCVQSLDETERGAGGFGHTGTI